MKALKPIALLVYMSVLLSACGGGGGGTTNPNSSSSSTDTTKPTVSQTSPASGATGVAINSAISVTFSKAVDASSVTTSTFQVTGVTGTVSVNGTTATFTPSSNLSNNTTYTVTLTTGIKDTAGNTMAANYTCSFTTGTQADTTPPSVSSISPANNATGTAVNAAVTATLSETMNASTINSSTFTLKQGATPVSGTVTYSGTTATFTPSSSLSYSTTYTATLTTGVKDAAGNAMASSYSWSFTTASGDGVSSLIGGSIQGNPLNLTNAVTTFAGSAYGLSGSTDGTGTAARFYYPFGITTDGTNLFVTDTGNQIIRKIVKSSGVVTIIAGYPGIRGSTDGTGIAARFSSPFGITTDGTNLFVTDAVNSTIRKIVISTGAVTTIAGSAGVIGSTDGTGAAARFSSPCGITTDGTNLYVADTYNHTIRKLVISTEVVTTIAGSAGIRGSTDGTGIAARFSSPFGITTDGTNLFVTDTDNSTIRKIVISTGAVTTIAGSAGVIGSTDGTGAVARFYYPFGGITTDGTNLYVADTYNQTIRKLVISTEVVTTIAGSAGVIGSTDGTGAAARFSSPRGISTDGSNLFVADSYNNTIRKIQ